MPILRNLSAPKVPRMRSRGGDPLGVCTLPGEFGGAQGLSTRTRSQARRSHHHFRTRHVLAANPAAPPPQGCQVQPTSRELGRVNNKVKKLFMKASDKLISETQDESFRNEEYF